jgi:hypothetical protein
LPLALILLSLLLQALAPARAAAMAAARLDPWANLPVCGSSAQRDHGAPTSQQEGCCHSACLVCAAASSLATLAQTPTPAAPFAYVAIILSATPSPAALAAPTPRPRARDPPIRS